MKYCETTYQTKRWKSRVVMVGNVGVGGDNPVRIQSMTTSNTRDVEATIEQIMRLADCGCDIARVTVQGMKEADACEGIKNGLIQKGYTIPVVADIHFYPPAAMRVIDFVDKVRINPGNFVDKRAQFKVVDYDDATYASEVARIEEKFAPLLEKCKKLKRALRIGTNHGSLSDRIMNRYGDTAFGMVESALEFTTVARKYDFHDLIFSMKASNTQVMIQAYRLLVAKMIELGWDYPLHLGVTEAGEGEDGRVKSSIGIGSLLLDGLGDTIRVSLTEDPWCEIDPCQRLVAVGKNYIGKGVKPFEEKHRKIEAFEKREVDLPSYFHRDGTVVLNVTEEEVLQSDFYQAIGCKVQFGKPMHDVGTVDALVIDRKSLSEKALDKLKLTGITLIDQPYIVNETNFEKILKDQPQAIFFAPKDNYLHNTRLFIEWIKENKVKAPVILNFLYDLDSQNVVIKASAEYGSLFCDGIGEGIFLQGPYALKMRKDLSFSILQGCRMRNSKTEFISCPGCGRTLFDLQKVAAKIRDKTAHLPGVKIAIMGCIVNGPGEMADADFGYVGSKPGKIDLYIGKQCVERDIDMADADERLIDLIKSHGRWIDKDPLVV